VLEDARSADERSARSYTEIRENVVLRNKELFSRYSDLSDGRRLVAYFAKIEHPNSSMQPSDVAPMTALLEREDDYWSGGDSVSILGCEEVGVAMLEFPSVAATSSHCIAKSERKAATGARSFENCGYRALAHRGACCRADGRYDGPAMQRLSNSPRARCSISVPCERIGSMAREQRTTLKSQIRPDSSVGRALPW
jgi:hypothetical protein